MFLYSNLLVAQVRGKVFDNKGLPIPYVNVIFKDFSSERILKYTISDKNGAYSIDFPKIKKSRLFFSGMNYDTKVIPLEIKDFSKPVDLDVHLISKDNSLNEVMIKGKRPITIKGDTIVFDAKAFERGDEEVVEDLLQNIPGVDVDDEGTIRVGNKEVEKVMVEGDDFFEKGYKILTQSMPSNSIENVEILEHYSANKHLKGIEESDKVALNLSLKEEAKRQWFGNVGLGYDFMLNSKSKYDFNLNLMNFGSKSKYYALSNINNIGYDAKGLIYHLIRPSDADDRLNLGYREKAYNLINISDYFPTNFKKSRTNLNSSRLVSLNAIFNPNSKLKIKTLAFFDGNRFDFYRNKVDAFYANNTGFTNLENYHSTDQNDTYFGKFDINYDISKTKSLKCVTKYSYISGNKKGDLLFNDISTVEKLKNENTFFNQKINYVNKLSKGKVLLFTGSFIRDNSPQDYQNNRYFFRDIFSNTDADNVAQFSRNKMDYVGLEANFLKREKKGNLLELKSGYTFRNDELSSVFDIKQNNIIVEQPLGYKNDFSYLSNNLYLGAKYLLRINRIAFTGKLTLNKLFDKIRNQNTTQEKAPFYVGPSVGFKWDINDRNKVSSNYSFNTDNATVSDVYSNYVLTGGRSFNKGMGHLRQLNTSFFILNYQFGNWQSKLFANTFVTYIVNHDFFATDATIRQNYSLFKKIAAKNKELLTASTNMDIYIKAIKTNLKIRLGFSKSNYKNSVNGSGLREIKSMSYSWGTEMRSAFRGMFNYHIGTRWTASAVTSDIKKSYINNMQFLDLVFAFSENITLKTQLERYYFGNLNPSVNTYYFLDFEAKYIVKKNKLSFSLIGKNIFNTQIFRNFSISDIGTSTIEYRLMPRFVLLKAEYRF